MKYFLDTEFIEDGKTIDLISIGIVSEDGREYYAVSTGFNPSKASDWVLENVLLPMGIGRKGWISAPDLLSPSQKNHWDSQRTLKQIGEEILIFLNPSIHGKPEFWGYYSDYDWVVFCQIWGTMMDLPSDFPMYCRDLKQWCDQLGNPRLPSQDDAKHNALNDAKWNRKAWNFLQEVSQLPL